MQARLRFFRPADFKTPAARIVRVRRGKRFSKHLRRDQLSQLKTDLELRICQTDRTDSSGANSFRQTAGAGFRKIRGSGGPPT
jgi:hypothetical protein